MASLLIEITRTDPGRFLTAEELRRLETEEPYLAPRIRAARNAEAQAGAIVKAAVDASLARYDFATGRAGYGPDKCYRDVGTVYRYCVFAMLCDDIDLLKNKLLYWLRTILRGLNFPCGVESIRFTYGALRKEMHRRLPKEDAALLDPFFVATEEVLTEP